MIIVDIFFINDEFEDNVWNIEYGFHLHLFVLSHSVFRTVHIIDSVKSLLC